MGQEYKYYAFISYNSEDDKWARWLQNKLETYHLPSIVKKDRNDLPKKINPIFRYKTDLDIGDLSDNIKKNLQSSKFLIIVCSPHSANSAWVGKEISYFTSLGREKQIIAFIIEGTPYAVNKDEECYNDAIKNLDFELLGADINASGKERNYVKKNKAYIKIISYMLGLNFDTLWQREKRRRKRQRIICACFVLFLLTLIFSIVNYFSPKNANISLTEQPPINKNLPFPVQGAKLYFSYGGKTDSIDIKSLNQKIEIKQISGKFFGTKAKVKLNIFGFYPIDSNITISSKMNIAVKRDDSYGIIAGVITNDNLDPINNAIVSVLNKGIVVKSNAQGKFIIKIPFSKQEEYQTLVFEKNNYESKVFRNKPISQNWKVVLNKK